MPIVAVPAPFRGVTRGEPQVEVDGCTVEECLEAVERRYSGFRELVLDADGRARGWTQIYVNDRPLAADGLGVAVESADRIEILASIGGG